MGITKDQALAEWEAEQQAREGNVDLLMGLLGEATQREYRLLRYLASRGLYQDYAEWRIEEAKRERKVDRPGEGQPSLPHISEGPSLGACPGGGGGREGPEG